MVTRVLARTAPRAADAAQSHTGLAFVDTSWGRISLTLHRQFDGATAVWKTLQSLAPTTHAQCLACARAWFEEVSGPAGAEAAIIVGRSDSGRPLFLWPLEIVTRRGLRAMQWIGQEIANYNMGLYDPRFAKSVTEVDATGLLRAGTVMAGGVSLARFKNQPAKWEGVPNPLLKLPNQPSPSCGYAILLDRDFDTLYRNRFGGRTRNTLRRKERKLADLGTLEYGWARTDKDRRDLFDAFFRQKSDWFARLGIADPFAEPQHRAFFERLAALPEGTPGRLELGYLKVGDILAATYNGAQLGSRFHLLLSSIEHGETERSSPGILLLRRQVEDMCQRGCSRYDLGVGRARHKSEWADEEIPLFDSFLAFDELGYLFTLPLSAAAKAKRVVKNNPTLWALAQTLRRVLHARAAAPDADTA